MGYLKRDLSTEDKQELLDLIEDYRQGLLPLIVPLTLLKHHLSRYPVPEWVHQQVYLHPYPKELMLRNHVGKSSLAVSFRWWYTFPNGNRSGYLMSTDRRVQPSGNEGS
jgi:hypothetical protein